MLFIFKSIKVNASISLLPSQRTTLSKFCKGNIIIMRNMHNARAAAARAAQAVVPKNPNVPIRPYATYGLHNADNASPDPKATINNPPVGKKAIRHPEIHRTRCDQPGCTGKVCVGLCGNTTDRKAVAHATHGQSPENETYKKTVPAMEGKDFNGNNKDQNLVFYNDAHTVNSTTALTQGIQEIQSNTSLQDVILGNEDIK